MVARWLFAGGLRSVVAATAQPAGTARKSGQKLGETKPFSAAATTERSPPAPASSRRAITIKLALMGRRLALPAPLA